MKIRLTLVLCSILTLFLILGSVSAVDIKDNSFINDSSPIDNTLMDTNYATDINVNLKDNNSDVNKDSDFNKNSHLEKDDNHISSDDFYLKNNESYKLENNKGLDLEDTNFLIHPQVNSSCNLCYNPKDSVFEFDHQKICVDDLINNEYENYLKNGKVTLSLKNNTKLLINQVEPFNYEFIFYKKYKESILEKTYYFENIYNWNDLKCFLAYNMYNSSYTLYKSVIINSEEDYEMVYNISKKNRREIFSDLINKVDENKTSFALNIIFTKSLFLEINNPLFFSNSAFNKIIIDGNYSTISPSFNYKSFNSGLGFISENSTVIISNLNLRSFNKALINKGFLALENIKFIDHNRISSNTYGGALTNYGYCNINNVFFSNGYGEYGGALANLGICNINNGTFEHNIAHAGGAIYNRGHLSIENSFFNYNIAPNGRDIYNLNCYQIYQNNSNPIIKDFSYMINIGDESLDLKDILYSLSTNKSINNYTNINLRYGNSIFTLSLTEKFNNNTVLEKLYTVNATSIEDFINHLVDNNCTIGYSLIKNVNITYYDDYFDAYKLSKKSHKEVFSNLLDYVKLSQTSFALNIIFTRPLEIYDEYRNMTWFVNKDYFNQITIEGSGSKIFTKNIRDSKFKFANVVANSTFIISNLIISGFNGAIWNEGFLLVANTIFEGNKMDYWYDPDYGGAIQNICYCYCTNVTFINNYAKNGGAIFNQGKLVLDNCSFSNNTAYGEGNDICSHKDLPVSINNCGKYTLETVSKLPNWGKHVIKTIFVVLTISFASAAAVLTANPLIGMAIGAGIGSITGTIEASVIISNSYDLKFDRNGELLGDIVMNTITGAFTGYYVGIDAKAVVEFRKALYPKNPFYPKHPIYPKHLFLA